MAKYLVTGIAGFIGSSIAHELVSRGETVRGLDDFSTGKWANIVDIQNDIDFRQASLLDKLALASGCAGIDYVVHQAALPSVPKSVVEPELTHAVNVNGTLNLLLAARYAGVKRLVYAASSSAYGESEVLPKREDMLPRPISPYAVQKLTGEYYMQTFSAVYGLETVSLRYFNIFGPRQDANSQYSAVPAKDVSGKVFNIATGSRFSLNQTFEMLRKIIGFSRSAKFAPPRTGDVKHSLADITLAQKHLGYSADVSFEEGLRRTVEWYEQQASAKSGTQAVVAHR